jgi:transcription elongation factor GreA
MRDLEPITKKGKQKLEDELDLLIKVEREKIKKDLSEARALGDLKENAEYHAAKEKQSHIEGRISELQSVLTNSQVINIGDANVTKVVFGATVKLYDTQKDCNITYQIVGHHEADIAKGKVSFASPLGKALIGKEEGDIAVVKAPKGDIEYEVQSIEYID